MVCADPESLTDHSLSLSVHTLFAYRPPRTSTERFFTTHSPSVPDVFDSGPNVRALRPVRRVGFRSLAPGGQTTFRGVPIIFVMTTALKLLKLGPNSKRGK